MMNIKKLVKNEIMDYRLYSHPLQVLLKYYLREL